MLKRLLLASAALAFTTSCVMRPPPPPPMPAGFTFWGSEQIPMVGSIVRITPMADEGFAATIVSHEIANRLTPAKGSARDYRGSTDRSREAKAVINLIRSVTPSAGAQETGRVAFEVIGGSTLTVPDELTVKSVLMAIDSDPNKTPAQRNLMAQINAQRNGQGSLYIVTGVQTAKAMKYTTKAEIGFNVGIKCAIGDRACGEVSFADKITQDGEISATGVPTLVRLKWIGQNSATGNVVWTESSEGPDYVTGS